MRAWIAAGGFCCALLLGACASPEQRAGAEGLTGVPEPAATEQGRTVDAVEPAALQSVFPELDGWSRGRPSAAHAEAPAPHSHATVTYSRGTSRIDAILVDSGFSRVVLEPYGKALAMASRESDDGYERSTIIHGGPAFESWNSRRKDAELVMIVAERFGIRLTGAGIDDPEVVHRLAEEIDLGVLAGSN
jgi:hypothetical protein